METKIKSTNLEDLCKDPRKLRQFFVLKNVSISIPGECPYCDQHFTDLRIHLKPKKRKTIPKEMILTNFDCNFCQLILPNEECIRNHQENIHGKGKIISNHLACVYLSICQNRQYVSFFILN